MGKDLNEIKSVAHRYLFFTFRKRKERLQSTSVSESDLEAAAIQTAQDYEDAANEQFHKFKPASRMEFIHENNDGHSLKRHLDRNLLLLTKVKHSREWEVPSFLHCHGSTLRQVRWNIKELINFYLASSFSTYSRLYTVHPLLIFFSDCREMFKSLF